MVKLIVLAVLAVGTFILGGFASLQLADMAGQLPVLVRVGALALGGLVFTWLVFVMGSRLLEIIYGATDDEDAPEPAEEKEEKPVARKPAGGAPKKAA